VETSKGEGRTFSLEESRGGLSKELNMNRTMEKKISSKPWPQGAKEKGMRTKKVPLHCGSWAFLGGYHWCVQRCGGKREGECSLHPIVH